MEKNDILAKAMAVGALLLGLSLLGPSLTLAAGGLVCLLEPTIDGGWLMLTVGIVGTLIGGFLLMVSCSLFTTDVNELMEG